MHSPEPSERPEAPYSVTVGLSSPTMARRFIRAIEDHPRLQLRGEMPNATLALAYCHKAKPVVACFSYADPTIGGHRVFAELANASPDTLILLAVNEPPANLLCPPGVAAVVDGRDLPTIRKVLDAAVASIENPGDLRVDRRGRNDRRVQQDWSKVFAERRNGPRRQSDDQAEAQDREPAQAEGEATAQP